MKPSGQGRARLWIDADSDIPILKGGQGRARKAVTKVRRIFLFVGGVPYFAGFEATCAGWSDDVILETLIFEREVPKSQSK